MKNSALFISVLLLECGLNLVAAQQVNPFEKLDDSSIQILAESLPYADLVRLSQTSHRLRAIARGVMDRRRVALTQYWQNGVLTSTTLKGHTNKINTLSFSHDDKFFASGAENGEIRIWDIQAGKEIHKFQGSRGPVKCVAFSPIENLVASCTVDGFVQVYRVGSSDMVCEADGHDGWLFCVAFSCDGTMLASCSSDNIRLWSVEQGQLTLNKQYPIKFAHCIAFSHDNKFLGCQKGLIDLTTGEIRKFDCNFAWQVAFSPDDKAFILQKEWQLDLLNVQTLKTISEIKCEFSEGCTMGFARETPLFIYLDQKAVKIMHLPNTHVIREIVSVDMDIAMHLHCF